MRLEIVSKYNTLLCNGDRPFVVEGNGGKCSRCPSGAKFVLQNNTCVKNGMNVGAEI